METFSRLTKVVIAVVFIVWRSTRSTLFRILGYPTTSSFIVLMYHSIKTRERESFARQMDQLVSVATPVYANFAGAACTKGRTYAAVTFDDAYESILKNAIPILRERDIPATLFVPTRYLGGRPEWITSERHRNADERLLTAHELKDLGRSGSIIGSHSVTHRRLTELSHTEVLAELNESREVLEDILGEKVKLFALPYDASNGDIERLARQAGYEQIFVSVPVRFNARNARNLVGRIAVTPTDWRLEYWLKVRGAYEWLPLAIVAKSRTMNVLKRFLKTVSVLSHAFLRSYYSCTQRRELR